MYGSTVVTKRSDILSAGVDSVVVASEAVKFSVSDVVVMPSSETLVVVVSLSSKSASRSAKRSIRFHSQSRGLQLQMVPSSWICRKPEVLEGIPIFLKCCSVCSFLPAAQRHGWVMDKKLHFHTISSDHPNHPNLAF